MPFFQGGAAWLHASQRILRMEAYVACIYVMLQLLCSKYLVAPLEKLTVPNLELTGPDVLERCPRSLF